MFEGVPIHGRKKPSQRIKRKNEIENARALRINVRREFVRKNVVMSKLREIQKLVRNGLYYLTEHADEEAATDGFDIYDV